MQRYYAMKAKEDAVRLASSSGGVFYHLGSRILAQGGTVYGACYDENWRVVHRRADTVEQLRQFSGSKYARSDWKTCLPQIKADLLSGIPVLFSGTPCQVAAVKKLESLGTLYLVDIICHGTPQPQYLAQYLQMMQTRFGASVKELSMRYKPSARFAFQKKHLKTRRFRLDSHTMRILFSNGKEYCCDSDYDPYYLLMDSLFCESCYHCTFSSFERHSDLTLGDFHEFAFNLGTFNDRNGVSLVLANTEKGQQLLTQVMHQYDWQEMQQEQVVQPALTAPVQKPTDTESLRFAIEQNGFLSVADKKVFRNPRLQLRRICDRLGILDGYLYLKRAARP